MKRRIRRKLQAREPRGPTVSLDLSPLHNPAIVIGGPAVRYSLDGGRSFHLATVEQFERETGCTLTFAEPP